MRCFLLVGMLAVASGSSHASAFGIALCDGSSHHLSTLYASLGAAQADFPFVTSLSQERDYVALKAASNAAFGADGSEHGTTHPGLNLPLDIPPGRCELGSDTWLIRAADGIRLNGAGTTATTLEGAGPVLAFDGLWYSEVGNMSIFATSGSSIAAFEVDGNVPGHPYATMGVQANRFPGLLVSGGGGTYAMTMCRQGGGGGQCSENTFDNFHGLNAATAVYFQNGFNAIANVFVGGDMQAYQANGILLNAGSVKVLGTSFESTAGYVQIANGGCDINASSSGTEDAIIVHGSRSESLCFYKGSWPQWPDIRGFTHIPAVGNSWSGNHNFSLNDSVITAGADNASHLYVVTTAGRSAASPPTWPATGTITDGSAVWTMTPYNVVKISDGSIELFSSKIHPSATVVKGDAPSISACGTNPSLGVDATSHSGTVTEGTSATGCRIAWSFTAVVPPHCVVSSPNGAPWANVSSTVDALTITNAQASGNQYTWLCEK